MPRRFEDIRGNIVKIVDENKKFHGTGFLIEARQDTA
jgi:hypothetical protein